MYGSLRIRQHDKQSCFARRQLTQSLEHHGRIFGIVGVDDDAVKSLLHQLLDGEMRVGLVIDSDVQVSHQASQDTHRLLILA